MLHRRHTSVGLIFYFACIGLNSAPPPASINTCKSGQQTFLTVSQRKREMEDKMEKGRRVSAGAPMELRCGDGDESGNKSSMRSAETLLRLLPVALCTVSLVVMLKNSQTSDIGTLSYSDLGAFRYLVHANGICAGYSLLSAIFTAVPRPSTMCRAWTFFLLDQVLTYIILAAGSVSAEVQYLAYNGDEAVAWSDACSSFGVFCKKTTTSITITFVAVVCYAVLSLVSSYKLFTKYDAPISYNAKGIDLAGFHT